MGSPFKLQRPTTACPDSRNKNQNQSKLAKEDGAGERQSEARLSISGSMAFHRRGKSELGTAKSGSRLKTATKRPRLKEAEQLMQLAHEDTASTRAATEDNVSSFINQHIAAAKKRTRQRHSRMMT